MSDEKVKIIVTDDVLVKVKDIGKKYIFRKNKLYNIEEPIAQAIIEQGKGKYFYIDTTCFVPFKCKLIENNTDKMTCVFVKNNMTKHCAGPYEVESSGEIKSYLMKKK